MQLHSRKGIINCFQPQFTKPPLCLLTWSWPTLHLMAAWAHIGFLVCKLSELACNRDGYNLTVYLAICVSSFFIAWDSKLFSIQLLMWLPSAIFGTGRRGLRRPPYFDIPGTQTTLVSSCLRDVLDLSCFDWKDLRVKLLQTIWRHQLNFIQ